MFLLSMGGGGGGALWLITAMGALCLIYHCHGGPLQYGFITDMGYIYGIFTAIEALYANMALSVTVSLLWRYPLYGFDSLTSTWGPFITDMYRGTFIADIGLFLVNKQDSF